jgi:hypothetical protein
MLTTRVVFRCRECQAVLSKPVRLANSDELKFGNHAPYQPDNLVPTDAYTSSGISGSPKLQGFLSGMYIVHVDNQNFGSHHKDESRLDGCCGPMANMMLMNWVCLHGHEVGGLQTECQFPHGLAFNYLSDSDDLELPADAALELRSIAETHPTVLALAQGIAAAPQLDGLYALADALEESGYPNGRILEHLRANLVHHEGCIVLDWLLGK